jgi:hypothetical protein
MDAEGAAQTPRTERHRFVFSGVAFEVLADPRARFQLPEAYLEHVDDGRGCVLAEVICSVTGDAGHPFRSQGEHRSADEERSLTFRHTGNHTQIAAHDVLAEVSEIGRGKYAAAVRIAPDSKSARAMTLGVASAIVQRHGGLNLHAAAIELDGQALLFLGPSGAGKSTAAALSHAPVFASDRVNVAPDSAGQFWVFSLPGGTPVPGARCSERRALPLAGLMRVRQAPSNETPSLRELKGAARLFAVRAAACNGAIGLKAEDDLLQAILKLCERVRLSELHTVLDQPIGPLLRAERLRAEDHSAHV